MHQAVATPASAVAPPEEAPLAAQTLHHPRRSSACSSLWLVVSIILGKREKPIPVMTEKAVRKTIIQTVSATGKDSAGDGGEDFA